MPRRSCAALSSILIPSFKAEISVQEMTYELPDDNITTVGAEHFCCSEVFGKDASGIHDSSFQSIMKCNVEGPRCKLIRSGHSPYTVTSELVVSLKITAPTSLTHRVPAATAATAFLSTILCARQRRMLEPSRG